MAAFVLSPVPPYPRLASTSAKPSPSVASRLYHHHAETDAAQAGQENKAANNMGAGDAKGAEKVSELVVAY